MPPFASRPASARTRFHSARRFPIAPSFVLRSHFGYNSASRSPEPPIQNRLKPFHASLPHLFPCDSLPRIGRFREAPAADSVPSVVPESPADAAIVKRIYANWKARQDRTKSFHVEWNASVVQTLLRARSVAELRRALLGRRQRSALRGVFARLGRNDQLGPHAPRSTHLERRGQSDSGMAARSRRTSARSRVAR